MPRTKGETYFKATLCYDYLKRFMVKDYEDRGQGGKVWINGQEGEQRDVDIVMKWHRQGGVGLEYLDALLTKYGLNLSDFELWAEERDLTYLL